MRDAPLMLTARRCLATLRQATVECRGTNGGSCPAITVKFTQATLASQAAWVSVGVATLDLTGGAAPGLYSGHVKVAYSCDTATASRVMRIPLALEVLSPAAPGCSRGLVMEQNGTLTAFYVGKPPFRHQNRSFTLKNLFPVPIELLDVSFPPEVATLFKVRPFG